MRDHPWVLARSNDAGEFARGGHGGGRAAILFAPTVVGTVYGMNFDHMPALHSQYGYPLALALMVSISLGLYVLFKRRNWI
jgi:magnesium transporter